MYYLDDKHSPTGFASWFSFTRTSTHWYPSLESCFFLLTSSGISRLESESCELSNINVPHIPIELNNHSSISFELVHYDFWSPCHFSSFKGSRYFLVLANYFSRMTWMYLLKERFVIPHTISIFYIYLYFAYW